jgi:Cu/Ag efflux pump CusA
MHSTQSWKQLIQQSRPLLLTALAAVLAFIPLMFSVFWSSLAYTLIGGTAVGTVLTLVFLPALHSIWFRVKPRAVVTDEASAVSASQEGFSR